MNIAHTLRPRHLLAPVAGLTLLLAAWSQLAKTLLDSEPFMSHGFCYMWIPNLIALHVISDSIIALAYFTIPFTLLYLVRRRKDLPFNWMFLSFGAFIVACGSTHIMEIWTIWTPTYWLSGAIKAVTALVSITTAVALIKLVPSALAMPSVKDLEDAKFKLEQEIAERRQVEVELSQSRDELETRVKQRTVQLAETNEELQRAGGLKDQFLAMLSHELRTPLTAINGWVYLLQNAPLDQSVTKKGLEVIARNVKAQTQLVDDLLNVSRIILGNLRILPEWISGSAVIRSAVDSIRPGAENKNLEIVEKLDSSIDPIFVDPARFQQVLWNVLSNAVKFTPQDGKISVEFCRFENNVRVIVSDTGEGIDPDFLPHIFDRFSQGDTSPTRKHGGLGLGLSIVRHIVDLHGGHIQAHSYGKGLGSTFILDFPVPAIRPDAAKVSDPKAHEMALSGINIILVEDDFDSREVIAQTLQTFGAVVVQASGAKEALTLMSRLDPDVLISDIAMPEMDGYQLISSVKKNRPGLPAVALTAFAGAYDREKALGAGFDAHVPKPVNAIQLVDVVAEIVR